ncbi:outer membrane beta-barrel protein [candidate division KSB1 bacterium]|nr:outer membrane beta-barrel protein [candidate division KSB1 bacterium]
MRRTTLLLLLLAPVILINATNAFAWDGKRKGFVLGVGAGGGLASFKPYAKFSDNETSDGERTSKFAFMSDFKIGYAPSNQVALYWMSKVAWFGYTFEYRDEFIDLRESYTLANGIGGVGVSYYFQPEGPSPYVSAGFGFSTWDAPFEENSDGISGSGFALGAGYEFSKHWSLEGNLTWGSPNEKGDEELGFKTLAVRVTVNVLGY